MKNKEFIFLYPQEEIFQHEITKGSLSYNYPLNSEKGVYFAHMIKKAKTNEEKEKIMTDARKDLADSFRPVYSAKLNSCIYWRYKKNGFSINYAVLDDCNVSKIIELRPEDNVINVGIDAQTHRTKKEDGTYTYPDPDHILDQLNSPKRLVVAGFHMWDCVEKLARRSHERGISTLVDEDLTEFFVGRLKDKNFNVKAYPTYDAREDLEDFDIFMRVREGKPWLWQDY